VAVRSRRGIIDYRCHINRAFPCVLAVSRIGRGREQAEGAGTLHSLAAAVRAKLLVQVPQVRPDRVRR
jgi:hypothetical protein